MPTHTCLPSNTAPLTLHPARMQFAPHHQTITDMMTSGTRQCASSPSSLSRNLISTIVIFSEHNNRKENGFCLTLQCIVASSSCQREQIWKYHQMKPNQCSVTICPIQKSEECKCSSHKKTRVVLSVSRFGLASGPAAWRCMEIESKGFPQMVAKHMGAWVLTKM